MIIGIVIILILIIVFYLLKPSSLGNGTSLAPEPVPIPADQPPEPPKPVDFDKLSSGEQLQYIVDTYFPEIPVEEDTSGAAQQQAQDKAFVASLPVDNTSCSDSFDDCSTWADDGECEINPEFMLYNCPKSCKGCQYSEQDRSRLTRIYNSRPPAHCVYHGQDYPGNFQYMNRLYDYTVAVGF